MWCYSGDMCPPPPPPHVQLQTADLAVCLCVDAHFFSELHADWPLTLSRSSSLTSLPVAVDPDPDRLFLKKPSAPTRLSEIFTVSDSYTWNTASAGGCSLVSVHRLNTSTGHFRLLVELWLLWVNHRAGLDVRSSGRAEDGSVPSFV